VTNWGPIKHADVTLGDLTFVVGAQNTGKTYLSQLILLLSKFLNFSLGIALISAVARHLTDSKLAGIVSGDAVAISVEENPDNVAKYLKEEIPRSAKGILEQYIKTHYLVSAATDAIRQGEDQSRIEARFALGGEPLLQLTFTLERKGLMGLELEVNPRTLSVLVKQSKLQLTLTGVAPYWTNATGGPTTSMVKYIPAERFIVIPVFAQLMSLLLTIYRGLTQPGVFPQAGITQFTMRESFFDFLNDVNSALASPASYELMNFGNIDVIDRQVYFRDLLRHARVPIACSGSGVAQLTGILLVAERSGADFFIIEEPEVNLHADAQLQVADYLGKLSSRKGVFVTTHSQYLMAKLSILRARREISNLRGYYVDPSSGEFREIEINEKTGEVELPESIEKALETISKEAMAVSRQFFGAPT
jgi:hypothetical protein